MELRSLLVIYNFILNRRKLNPICLMGENFSFRWKKNGAGTDKHVGDMR